MGKKNQRIAVVGAGITGTVASLMLAEAGYRVCLFDKADRAMTGASLVNEGKIYLGFVYVNDPSLRSLDVMVETAVVFRSILERWIPGCIFDTAITEPFEYIVPRDTQVLPEEIERKFDLVARKILDAEKRQGTRYLDKEREIIWKPKTDEGERYNRDYIIAQYETMERSVDTHLIAEALRDCLMSNDNIELYFSHEVDRIQKTGTTWSLHCRSRDTEERFGPFDHVINASWDGRLKLDAQVFGPEKFEWFHRFKHALNLQPDQVDGIPNFTAIIGTYGDVILYPSGRVYLSYYPAGMLSAGSKIEDVQTVYDDSTRDLIASETLAGLSKFVPSIGKAFSPCKPNGSHVTGGIIMARGRTDIDDHMSELHQRYKIGIRQKGNYMSIDTGKYTCGPALAEEAVHRITGG
ncbi:MAG: FAD-dependent oxidoreductase [Verrucomicrobiae bacterium]|nr:FAD-dependent oxidoreductase [Verrucomicrobiae bacterium]